MEFLSEAVGELDNRLIVGVAVSVFVAAVRPLLGVVTEWLYGLWNRQAGEADSSGPGLARPQPLRSHRQPGNRPARPFQGSTPEKLARSMRCSGRVPVSHYRHQRWLVAFWRAMKLYLLSVKTLPKSAFPDGAVWLVVPTSAYCPPAAAWGQAAERLNQQTRATIEAAPQDCRDLDDEDYVRHWVKWNRKVTLAIWAVLGPGTFVMAILAPSLAPAFLERLPAAFETFVEVGIVTWVWYSSAYAVTRLAASRTASRQPQRTAAYPGRPRAHAANAIPPQTRLASAARSPRTGQSLRRHGRSGAGTEQPHTSQNTGAEEASRRRRRVTRHCDRRVRSPRGAL